MSVKLHNNQSPMGIRFCCISLEIILRARWKRQDSATVYKSRAHSDSACLAKGIILPAVPYILIHLPNNKCKKKKNQHAIHGIRNSTTGSCEI